MGDAVNNLSAKVALQELLDKTPEHPRTTLKGRSSIHINEKSNKVLALNHEISVVQQLAFICAYSDRPQDVTAVCVEELVQGGLIFRLAANNGSHTSLVKGLGDIAGVLENEARSSMFNCFPYVIFPSFCFRPGGVITAVSSSNISYSFFINSCYSLKIQSID